MLDSQLKNARQQHPNGTVLIERKALRNVVSSASEAETCGIFHNAQTAVPIYQILSALPHP